MPFPPGSEVVPSLELTEFSRRELCLLFGLSWKLGVGDLTLSEAVSDFKYLLKLIFFSEFLGLKLEYVLNFLETLKTR